MEAEFGIQMEEVKQYEYLTRVSIELSACLELKESLDSALSAHDISFIEKAQPLTFRFKGDQGSILPEEEEFSLVNKQTNTH